MTPLQQAIAKNAINHVQKETRSRIAQRPSNGKLNDGLMAALDLPADELLHEVAKRIAAGIQPNKAAVQALDAWIKRRREGINRQEQEATALAFARRLLILSAMIKEGHSMQDWAAKPKPYAEVDGSHIELIQYGGHMGIASIDGRPAASLTHPSVLQALQGLEALLNESYRQTVQQVCRGFSVERMDRHGLDDLVLHDKRGRRARAYIDGDAVYVYEIEGLALDSSSALAQGIAASLETRFPRPYAGAA